MVTRASLGFAILLIPSILLTIVSDLPGSYELLTTIMSLVAAIFETRALWRQEHREKLEVEAIPKMTGIRVRCHANYKIVISTSSPFCWLILICCYQVLEPHLTNRLWCLCQKIWESMLIIVNDVKVRLAIIESKSTWGRAAHCKVGDERSFEETPWRPTTTSLSPRLLPPPDVIPWL
ncbi:hypothetical protein OPV22_023853 [Ensete ventricosum]|uniref:Uncharacterized protein n=1 Tax=Ensete ventricosum TaxID=4639 RepID=A0AAV8PD75_ENSVE|nr:hypothetical protein OPV22_023853 [Ensete ventricosum]